MRNNTNNVVGQGDDLTHNPDYAMFLPAISEMYSRFIVNDTPKREPPAGITRQDLNFLEPGTRLFYLPASLYSAGQAAKSNNVHARPDMVQDRTRPGSLIVGDSGGYQIITGAIKWAGDYTRKHMLKWLEEYCDWSMVLDFPTSVLTVRGQGSDYVEHVLDSKGRAVKEIDHTGKRVPKKIYHKISLDFCLDNTLANNDYFIIHRIPGKTKFLNVIQGRNNRETDWWYDAVRHYSNPSKYATQSWLNALRSKYGVVPDLEERAFEGWALADKHKEDFAMTMRRIVTMRDDGLLQNKDWLHFLGMGKLRNGCVYTTIQRKLREDVNPNITISYDVSSPFTSAAYGRIITSYNISPNQWSFQTDTCEYSDRNSTEPLRGNTTRQLITSPIADLLTVKDLCVNNDPKYTSSWDICSYAMMMNHNTYMYVKAYQQAQALYDLPHNQAINHVPLKLLEIKERVLEILNSETPMDLIQEHETVLRGLGQVNNVLNNSVGDDLFEGHHEMATGVKNMMTKDQPNKSKYTTQDIWT